MILGYEGAPPTPKKPVTDEYHEMKVVDEYRWLENADDPVVRDWTEKQNYRTRAVLDQIPSLAPLRARLKEDGCTPASRLFLQITDTAPNQLKLWAWPRHVAQ